MPAESRVAIRRVTRDEFRAWLRDGAAGEMDWIERGEEKRSDPQMVLPGARSVIVFALNYWQGEEVRRSQTAATGTDASRVTPGAMITTM